MRLCHTSLFSMTTKRKRGVLDIQVIPAKPAKLVKLADAKPNCLTLYKEYQEVLTIAQRNVVFHDEQVNRQVSVMRDKIRASDLFQTLQYKNTHPMSCQLCGIDFTFLLLNNDPNLSKKLGRCCSQCGVFSCFCCVVKRPGYCCGSCETNKPTLS